MSFIEQSYHMKYEIYSVHVLAELLHKMEKNTKKVSCKKKKK